MIMEKEKHLHSFFIDKWHYIFLFAFLIFFTVHTARFISLDRSPIASVSHIHYTYALDSYQSVGKTIKISLWYYFTNDYPPLLYIATGFFFKIFGVSIKSALWSIYPFSIIFIISLFLTGLHFGGKSGAVAVCLIGSANIYFLNFSHLYMPDVPHSAMVFLAFYFLLKSEFFKKPVFTYLFGFAFGLSMLCRFNSIFFIAGPLIFLFGYHTFRSLRTFITGIFFVLAICGTPVYITLSALGNRNNLNFLFQNRSYYATIFIIVSVAIFALTFFVERNLMHIYKEKGKENVLKILWGIRTILISQFIAIPYYIYALPSLTHRLNTYVNQGFIPDQLRNYIENIKIVNNFFPMIFILVIIGIIFIFIRKKQLPDFILLLSMGISGFVITTHFTQPIHRFLLGEVLVFSVLGGYWVGYAKRFKFPALAFIFAFSVLSMSYLFFSPAVPLKTYEIEDTKIRPFFYRQPIYPTNPDPDQSKIYRIVDDITVRFRESMGDKYETVVIYLHHSDKYTYQGDHDYNFLRDTYSMYLKRLLRYSGINSTETRKDSRPVKICLEEKKESLVILLVGYVDRDYPDRIIRKIEDYMGRKVEFVSKYGIMGKKKINIYFVYPEK